MFTMLTQILFDYFFVDVVYKWHNIIYFHMPVLKYSWTEMDKVMGITILFQNIIK